MAAGKKTNWFAIWIAAAAVVVVVIVAGAVVWANSLASTPGTAPTGANVDSDTGAIVFGDGDQTVDTYIDFMCPLCNQFEQADGATLEGLVADGTITLNVHPVSILDRQSQGTRYSTRAAAAMFAVASADPENAYAYLETLFANQPEEGTPGLSDDELIQLAKDAGVDVTAELEASIRDQEFADYVAAHSLPEGAKGTPTLVINGGEPFSPPRPYNPQDDILSRLN